MKELRGDSLDQANRTLTKSIALLRMLGLDDSEIRRCTLRALRDRGRRPLARKVVSVPTKTLLNTVSVWANDPKYCDSSGVSLKLSIRGKSPSFESLLLDSDSGLDVSRALRVLRDAGSLRVVGRSVVRVGDAGCLFGGPHYPLELGLFFDNWLAFLNSQLDLLTNTRRVKGATFYTVSGYALPKSKLPELRDQLRTIFPTLLEIDAWLLSNRVSDRGTKRSAKNLIRPFFGVFLDEVGSSDIGGEIRKRGRKGPA